MESQSHTSPFSFLQAVRFTDLSTGGLNFLLIVVSMIVWSTEAVLLMHLWRVHQHSGIPFWFYPLPVFHLLPWFVGLQLFWKARRAMKLNPADPAAKLFQRVIVSFMMVSYTTLGAIESALGSALAFGITKLL